MNFAPRLLRLTSLPLRKYFLRRKTSALFIPGSKATETYSFLTPHLDIDERLADIDKLKFNVNSRKMKIDIDDLKKSWEFYRDIDNSRMKIAVKRAEISSKIKLISKKQKPDKNDEEELEGLKVQGTVLKKDLKNVRQLVWELEETIMTKALSLPNDIDEKTPLEPVVLRSVKSILKSSKTQSKSHIDIGKSLDLIEYRNPLCYYLTNNAAHFELGTLTWTSKILDRNNLLRVSGTDFSYSFVVEGAALDHEELNETFILQDTNHLLDNKNSINKLHLMGGASFSAFLAMHTKQMINPKSLPMKLYACGRQYSPSLYSDHELGLFGVSQHSAVQCFIVLKSKRSEEYHKEFKKMIDIILSLYDELGRHYRVILKPAHELRAWESLKVTFELWSRFKQDYIEVGHLSMCGDYPSMRLLTAYQTPEGREYPVIISGTIISITKLLGCLLEENEDKFVIPSCIKRWMTLDSDNVKSV